MAETKKGKGGISARRKGTSGSILAEACRHAKSCGWSVTEITPDPRQQPIDYGCGLKPGDRKINFLPRTEATESLFELRDRHGAWEVTAELTRSPAWPQAVLFFKTSGGKLFSLEICCASQMTEESFRMLITTP